METDLLEVCFAQLGLILLSQVGSFISIRALIIIIIVIEYTLYTHRHCFLQLFFNSQSQNRMPNIQHLIVLELSLTTHSILYTFASFLSSNISFFFA